jgi:hypothetical protein
MRKIIFTFFCYKINVGIIIFFLLINSSYEDKLFNLSEIQTKLDSAVYYISNKNFGLYNNLLYNRNENALLFSNSYENSMKNIRLISIKNEENVYYMELIKLKMFIGVNETNTNILTIYNNQTIFEKNNTKIKWKLYPINDEEFLIQNMLTKKFWKTKNLIYPECSSEIILYNNQTLINISLIDFTVKFKIRKLYEEIRIKSEYLQIIQKEPIDVLIKYIDLSDPNLNREGIKHIKKDEDNGELKYCLRSIFKYIPWIRKIFILMPNEKVSFLKPQKDIKDKIIYVKDKDLLGFDSESSTAFQYALFKLKDYGISNNFILMDDDYFIGRELNKWDFFYYDEKDKKVVPLIISKNYNYYKIQNKELKKWIYYSSKMTCGERYISHTPTGWKATKSRSLLFLEEQLGFPIINAGFDHNAIPVNLDDMEEIYNLIYLKYKYSFITLNSITRTRYDLQYQTLYNSYALNKLKRKVKHINSKFYDVKNIQNITLGHYGLFCINTGFNEYSKSDFIYLRKKLDELFPESTIYEQK